MITSIVLIILLFIIFTFFQSLLMVSASNYIMNTESNYFNKNLSYLRFVKINLQKLVRSYYEKEKNKVSYLAFISNIILIYFLTVPVVFALLNSLGYKISNDSEIFYNINSYYVLFAIVLVFVGRIINYISIGSKIDINKMVLKGVLATALVFLNFAFVNYYVYRMEKFFEYKIIIKILLFFNTAAAIYIFDNYTKFRKKHFIYQIKLLDKYSLYFILMGAFLLMNNNVDTNPFSKFIYYSISIFLIDFIASYMAKMFGYIKMKQVLIINYEYIFIYYLMFYLVIFLVDYGI